MGSLRTVSLDYGLRLKDFEAFELRFGSTPEEKIEKR